MDLNTILIILGVLALVILIAHGIWANRREKTLYFKNANTFSADARLREPQKPVVPPQAEITPPESLAPEVDPAQQSLDFEQPVQQTPRASVERDVNQIKIRLPNQPIHSEPVYHHEIKQSIGEKTIDQIEAELGNENTIDTHSEELRVQLAMASQQAVTAQQSISHSSITPPQTSTQSAVEIQAKSISEPKPQVEMEHIATTPPEFMMLYVVAAENQEFKGTRLAEALEKLGFIFGEKNIFHRHLDLTVASPILFSVANIQQPGTFNLQQMRYFSTIGVAMFMQLPSAGNDRANLRMMIQAARHLATELNGFVLTDKQAIFDENAEQQYLAQLN